MEKMDSYLLMLVGLLVIALIVVELIPLPQPPVPEQPRPAGPTYTPPRLYSGALATVLVIPTSTIATVSVT